MMAQPPAKSVAVIGAGAAGAVTAAALLSEAAFEIIRVFERRETPGGTWIYDPDPGENVTLKPGKLPLEIDPPLQLPSHLPVDTPPTTQHRWSKTPIYSELTTNVPDIAMSFSDDRFAYGPFVPHWVAKQYIQDYFARHQTDKLLSLETTVEDVSKIFSKQNGSRERWRLTLRRFDAVRHVDVWWQEDFDAVIIANGHYSVPYIPEVKGLEDFLAAFPDRVSHSKSYRVSSLYANKRVVVVGNSASGHDITTQLVQSGLTQAPVYQSRRSRSRWDGDHPPNGVEWKPTIVEYRTSTNEIVFDDGTVLNDVDAVIYCTGYKPSFPFWNSKANGGPIFDYRENRILGSYQHTFLQKYPYSIAIVGLPRVLTFRSFEYQAVAIARLFSGRSSKPLPSISEMREWEKDRAGLVKRERRKFHDIQWENGETMEWLSFLYELAGLPKLEGEGRYPPVLDEKTRWAIKHVRKYPEPGNKESEDNEGWVLVNKEETRKDILHFI
ncbi:putative dimethylaniline monooxygenase [Aaosphaeria arxii CBS 175.79]|uniref:Putative dimethylaniline monooxygenase n=1 Tax=Aaosphaeria arxii CBS 175.79 TaxID=1450172 RepID=A0A6A5X9R7_9PLEO|nr:putative dimethylaniline monooxygenase [Aaosphaeria arxii CBS 175.79]KAF2009660.1 putative dimethylaniline monooxygenase [Aaosphaeria arxii CBS 175.79]